MKFVPAIFKALRDFESFLGDAWMGVNTAHSDDATIVEGVFGDSHRFQTNSHSTIQYIIRAINPKSDDIICVLGCAKGRALCHFGRLRVKKAIGVEISTKLATIAAENAVRLKGRRALIEVKNLDATTVDLSECTVIYMFNPFGANTLRAVLSNLTTSRHRQDKDLTIIYVNPKFSDVFGEFSWLEKVFEKQRITGLRFVVYKAKELERVRE